MNILGHIRRKSFAKLSVDDSLHRCESFSVGDLGDIKAQAFF